MDAVHRKLGGRDVVANNAGGRGFAEQLGDQEQGKRLLVAVALGLGVILLWNQFVHKDEPPPGDLRGLRIQLVGDATGALVVLLVNTVLSIYKPRGMTRRGRRAQRERSA